MGNSSSNIYNGGNSDTNVTLEDTLDYIATNYILTMDFNNLTKMYEKKYCDKLIILTSDIIDKRFTDLEVKSMMNRVDTDKNIETTNKKLKCNEIAKFYIKIAHVFAAIITTINPEYVYTDIYGTIVKRTLEQKSSIPIDAKISINKINLCSEKINALQPLKKVVPKNEKNVVSKNADVNADVNADDEYEPTKTMYIHPDICSINIDNQNLSDEPGINELIDLYFDSDYDYKTGKFMGMSTQTKKLFEKDLKKFYTIFTGNKEMPSNIKQFSDIKMKDYSKKKFCTDSKIKDKTYIGTYKDKLFEEYANNLKLMIKSVNKKQDKLLDIINKLFIYNKKNTIRINPELNMETLQKIVEETRNLIIELYLKCESDFVEGVKIWEAIVESQVFDTTQKHIVQLEKEHQKLINPFISKKVV
jgi:hypothetical protein